MNNVLVYTVHKAASMFIHKINNEIADVLGIECWSINNSHHKKHIRNNGWETIVDNNRAPAVVGPIRFGGHPFYFPDDPAAHSIIIHVRDPRDVLTSFYYANAYNHHISKGIFEPSEEERQQWIEEGIDDFVTRYISNWKKRYEEVIETIRQCETEKNERHHLVHYEEMVLHYDRWLVQFLQGFSHLVPGGDTTPLFAHCLQKFQDEFKILPENVYRHKRKMIPGDHKEKLAPETIARIENEFSEILEQLGYS